MNNEQIENEEVSAVAETGIALVPPVEQQMQTTVIGGVGRDLVAILKKSIEKVEQDPAYIPQATAIRENVAEIINLAKTEVQTMVALKNIHSSK